MKVKKMILPVLFVLIVTISLLTACQEGLEERDNLSNESEIKTISTKELKDRINEENLVVVDIRSESEYIGWKLNDEVRGGHIKGAVDFPITWIKDLKDEEIIDLLITKGITMDKDIVVYDLKGNRSKEMAKVLMGLGYENVLNYSEGIVSWSDDMNLPMEILPNYEKLVHPEWINRLINGDNPSNYDGGQYKIFEVSWGEPKDYNKGHIPGAIHLDTNLIEEEPLWNRVSDEDIENMLIKNGVTHDTTVILYGSDTTAAARAASIMMYAGVEDVRLLNGGYEAWINSGFDIETKSNNPVAVKEFGVDIPAHPEYIIDTDEAKKILDDDNAELVSIRSWDEYIGETSGYTYIKPKGRIKGAVWGHAGSDPYHMEDYRNIDNTMRNYKEIADNWNEYGITKDKRIAFFCGTGWRASEAFFDAYLMGWDNIAVYDGGWYEWSMDKSNPVELGEPK